MKAPRLKNATLIAREEVVPYEYVEIWKADKGFYVYWRQGEDYLVLSRGPLKSETTAQRHAKGLLLTLQRIR